MNSISLSRRFIYLTDAFLIDSIQPSLSSAESNDTKYDPVVVTISANRAIWISTSEMHTTLDLIPIPHSQLFCTRMHTVRSRFGNEPTLARIYVSTEPRQAALYACYVAIQLT